MKITNILTTVLITAVSSQTVYLVRHGEKPPNGANGLNKEGLQRAQCMREIFSKYSGYNIGKIMAQTPLPDGHRARPALTVEPLAADLGLTVDVSCDRDDTKCVKDAVMAMPKDKNLLICWEHKKMTDILRELGDKDPPVYGPHFDIIWTYLPPYISLSEKTFENCPGLDVTAETGVTETAIHWEA